MAKDNIVELGDFGSFWLKSASDSAESPDVVRGDQLTTILPCFNPQKVPARA